MACQDEVEFIHSYRFLFKPFITKGDGRRGGSAQKIESIGVE